jgi:glycerol-3-phosphate dehydrogenase subunit B
MQTDVLVIGAGLAGLVAGWQAATCGRRTLVIAKGWGITHWHSGCLDVLGYYPPDSTEAVRSPADSLARLIERNPCHPYALAGLDKVGEALTAFQQLCAAAGYPMHGSLERSWQLPSAVGALRPTCLAPETMIAGDLQQRQPMLIVGFETFRDFYAGLIADNLSAQQLPARSVTLDVPTLRQRRTLTGVILADLFESHDFRAEVVEAIQPRLGDAARIGFPAVFGLRQPLVVKRDLEERLGRAVFEIPCLPPSVPGMRLHRLLVTAIEQAGGRIYEGMQVVAADAGEGRVTGVWSEAAARRRRHQANSFVLATGGVLGGGLVADHDGRVREVIFDLPVAAPTDRSQWFQRDFLDPAGHPIYRAGLTVNHAFQPLDGSGQPMYRNVLAAGATLADCDVLRERSLEGVAVVTGYLAGRRAAELS